MQIWISDVAVWVCHHQDRFFLPSFYPHFYSLVRSVLVPNRVSQPYKYPCARLAKQQATVAQVLSLLLFMCWAIAAHFLSFVSELLSGIRRLTLRRLNATVSGPANADSPFAPRLTPRRALGFLGTRPAFYFILSFTLHSWDLRAASTSVIHKSGPTNGENQQEAARSQNSSRTSPQLAS